MFIGLFVIWSSEYVTASCIFLVTLTASIIYQLFGRYWDYEADGEGYDNEEDNGADRDDRVGGGGGVRYDEDEGEYDKNFDDYYNKSGDDDEFYGENRNASLHSQNSGKRFNITV
jgi:hypothetical protein